MCIKVERQLSRRPSCKDSSISFPKNDFPKDSKKDFTKEKETTHRTPTKVSEKGESSTKRASEIKCFKCLGRGHVAAQCPTKRTIVLKGKYLYNSQEESTSSSDSESSHSSASKEHSFAKEGNLLMINNQPSLSLNDQRENIFHTRSDVLNNTFSLIIDSGSCFNCCSTRLVEKLNLVLIPHPKPYKLHWLNEDGDMKVRHQVEIKFSIGKFKDKVLCDVIAMEACHILLGRPWQFDRKTIHNDHTNEISFLHHSKTFVLHPLTPSQVASDQAQIRVGIEEESFKNSKEVSKTKIGESNVSNPKVISHEVLLTQKSFFHTLHEEQPSYLLLCQAILTCLSRSSLKNLLPPIIALLQEFKDIFFQKMILMDFLLLEGLSIKLILSQGLVFPIDLPIRQTQLKQRRLNPK